MTNIFTYGSLMYAPVWQRVVRDEYQSQVAVLRGYSRYAVKGEDYPAIIPSDVSDQQQGQVYLDISLSDLQRLDEFEGEYYQRLSVELETDAAELIAADAYVLKPEYRHILADNLWDVDAFEHQGLKRFLQRYGGFADSCVS